LYLHLGNDFLISGREVIAIINVDPIEEIDRTVKDIIELGEAERKLELIGEKEKAKCLVITDDRIYLSPISSLTLQKRILDPYKEG